jgi:2-polyprenyl-3-methyl-5-hydroxy-6-metoxy-1,4-benzoquinol methylase
MKRARTDEESCIHSEEFVWSEQGLSEAHKYILPVLLPWLEQRNARRVLDIGCGNGALTNEVSKAGLGVVGVEVSESGIAIAQRSYPRIRFLNCGVDSPLPDSLRENFDAVISVEVIEHLALPRLLFERAKEALCPGGSLFVTTPYHGYWKNLALALFNRFDEHWHPLRDFGHVKFFSADTLSLLFAEQGFKVARSARVGRVPQFAKSMIFEGVML